MRQKQIERQFTELHQAASDNDIAKAKTLIKQKKALTEIVDESGWCPAHCAALNGHYEMVELLLAHMKNKGLSTFDGNTIYHYICRGNNVDTVLQTKLIKKLAEESADLNIQNCHGESALHQACMRGSLPSIRTLLELGINIDIVNNRGESALFYAVQSNRPEVVELLIRFNCDVWVVAKDGNTAYDEAKKIGNERVCELLSSGTKHEASVTILVHGWNDEISKWEQIEQQLLKSLEMDVFLFAYASLSNQSTIEDLAERLKEFIDNRVTPNCEINIVCYSTGALITRYFLKSYYRKHYRGRLKRVIMCAPANSGSPFAKKGKTGIGKYYVGGISAECGKELLTCLECCSPFLWELIEDSLQSPDEQWFCPDEIMTTILQGGKEYDKNLMSSVTRGDMNGTDGTVTISGSSLNAKKFGMDLTCTTPSYAVRSSTAKIAFMILPSFNHASIIHSLSQSQEYGVEVYEHVRNALLLKKKDFIPWVAKCEKHNRQLFDQGWSPAQLLVMSTSSPNANIRFTAHVVTDSEAPHFGGNVPIGSKKLREAEQTLSEIMGEKRTHSRSAFHFYYVVDTKRLATLMRNLSKLNQNLPIVVTVCSSSTKHGKIIASSAFKTPFGMVSEDCAAYVSLICKPPEGTETALSEFPKTASISETFVAKIQCEDIDDMINELPEKMLDLVFQQISDTDIKSMTQFLSKNLCSVNTFNAIINSMYRTGLLLHSKAARVFVVTTLLKLKGRELIKLKKLMFRSGFLMEFINTILPSFFNKMSDSKPKELFVPVHLDYTGEQCITTTLKCPCTVKDLMNNLKGKVKQDCEGWAVHEVYKTQDVGILKQEENLQFILDKWIGIKEFKLVYKKRSNDIIDFKAPIMGDIRDLQQLLQHFKSQAQRTPADDRWSVIIADVYDTLICKEDKRFNGDSVYPGVVPFLRQVCGGDENPDVLYLEFAQKEMIRATLGSKGFENIQFITIPAIKQAEAEANKSKKKDQLRKIQRTDSIKCKRSLVIEENIAKDVNLTFEGLRALVELMPECNFFLLSSFFRKSKILSEMIQEKNLPIISLIHAPLLLSQPIEGVKSYFRTYIGAAALLYEIGVMREESLITVATEAVNDFEANARFLSCNRAISERWRELETDLSVIFKRCEKNTLCADSEKGAILDAIYKLIERCKKEQALRLVSLQGLQILHLASELFFDSQPLSENAVKLYSCTTSRELEKLIPTVEPVDLLKVLLLSKECYTNLPKSINAEERSIKDEHNEKVVLGWNIAKGNADGGLAVSGSFTGNMISSMVSPIPPLSKLVKIKSTNQIDRNTPEIEKLSDKSLAKSAGVSRAIDPELFRGPINLPTGSPKNAAPGIPDQAGSKRPSAPNDAAIPPKYWTLEISSGEKYPLAEKSMFVLGRNKLVVDIEIPGHSSSKQHAAISFRQSAPDKIQPFIMDLNSLNGTYINSQKIAPNTWVPLSSDDKITFGVGDTTHTIVFSPSS